MQKRPQSAASKPSPGIFHRVNDIISLQDSHKNLPDSFDNFNTTYSKYNTNIPLFENSDYTTQKHIILNEYSNKHKYQQNSHDIEKLLHQASYALKLNQIDQALNLYRSALSQALHIIPSYQFVELFAQIFKQLNERALNYLKDREIKFCDQIVQTLLQWTQLSKDQNQVEFIHFIKCPTLIQATVLNTHALHLTKVGKFYEGQAQLEKALDLLSSSKINESIHYIIGQTYLNYSSSLLYQLLYQEGMQVASTALTHLQQGLLQLQQNSEDELIDQKVLQSPEITELISDAYINIAICKEKLKLYQEAHFNYYSALVNAQKYLNQSRQNEINSIYDKFLSRQAGYLHQMSNIPKKHSRFPSKLPQQPFIDLVKSLEESVKVTSIGFLKKQRIILKEKRDYHKREQQSLNKFQAYTSQTKRPSLGTLDTMNETKRLMKPKISPKLIIIKNQKKLTKKLEDIKQIEDLNLVKKNQFKIKINQNLTQHSSDKQIKKSAQDEIPHSSILRYLENIIQDGKLTQIHGVVLLEDFQEIRLPIYQNCYQYNSQMVGRMLIYLFKAKHLLYFKYNAYEQNSQDQFSHNLEKDYQYSIIGHNFNVSDVVNEIYSNKSNEPDQIYASFLREFISEVCRQMFVNLNKQALFITNENSVQSGSKQILFFLNETNEYISVQQKNDYESLVFITQDSQIMDQIDNGIRPLVFKDQNTLMECQEEEVGKYTEQRDDIQPLIISAKYNNDFRGIKLQRQVINRQEEEDEDDIQPLIYQVPNINSDNDYESEQQQQKQVEQNSDISLNNDFEEEQDEEENQQEEDEEEFKIFDIKEEIEPQDRLGKSKYSLAQNDQNKAKTSTSQLQVQQRLIKQASLPTQMMFGRKDQEMFTIKIESEDQVSKEVIQVYADKKQTDKDIHYSLDQDSDYRYEQQR